LSIISGLITTGEEMTISLGRIIGRCLPAGKIVALIGELGSGKTVLTKGIAQGREVDKAVEITSPTFTIINEYPGRAPFFHMDAYRLQENDNISETGFGTGEDVNGVWVIEWADKIMAHLPADRITVFLEYRSERERTFTIEGDKASLEKMRKLFIKEGLLNGVDCREVWGDLGGQYREDRECSQESCRHQRSR
jgi:tRNA threonylcarbamoyladenosine biosynthesis protein TsaE